MRSVATPVGIAADGYGLNTCEYIGPSKLSEARAPALSKPCRKRKRPRPCPRLQDSPSGADKWRSTTKRRTSYIPETVRTAGVLFPIGTNVVVGPAVKCTLPFTER